MATLKDTINSVDWNELRNQFTSSSELFLPAEKKFKLLAHWARGLETIYTDNRALPFLREAQISSQDFFCSCSLGLYKCSASSIRTVFESVLYFSYFKDHLKELDSVITRNLYMSRSVLIEYHRNHTNSFDALYTDTKLKSDLEQIYKEASSIIHGQKPGTWHPTHILSERKFDPDICKEAVSLYCRTVDVINALLLCTLDYTEWTTINPNSRKIILSELNEEQLSIINKDIF